MKLLPSLYGVRVTFPILQNKQNADSAGEMTQCIKVLADKPDSFGLIPGTHVVEEENQLSSEFHMKAEACKCTKMCMHEINSYMKPKDKTNKLIK